MDVNIDLGYLMKLGSWNLYFYKLIKNIKNRCAADRFTRMGEKSGGKNWGISL